METPLATDYQPPVDKLLRFGECKRDGSSDWPDYLSLGFGPEHIPELIRMATDKGQWYVLNREERSRKDGKYRRASS